MQKKEETAKDEFGQAVSEGRYDLSGGPDQLAPSERPRGDAGIEKTVEELALESSP
jgi:hypothetical protein